MLAPSRSPTAGRRSPAATAASSLRCAGLRDFCLSPSAHHAIQPPSRAGTGNADLSVINILFGCWAILVVALASSAPQRISQSILTPRMLCEMRYLLGARSVERSGPAGIDDYAAADAGATVVGLEAVSDVPHVGVLVVLAVGV